MKKIIPILTILFIAACSSDDNISDSNIKLSEIRSEHYETKNENGKYDNYFSALVSNSATKDVKGHVIFYLKEYGSVNTESYNVPANNSSQFVFSINYETDKIIDESYLLKAEFVRE